MTKSREIIGIGAVMVDQIVLLPHFPTENTKIKTSSFYQYIGGPIPIALILLHQLGQSVDFVATVGDDQPGEFIRSSLEKHGIGIGNIIVQQAKVSAFSQVWINSSTGSRTIAYSQGTLEPLKADCMTKEILRHAKIVHVDAREKTAAIAAAEKAKDMGVKVSFDTGSPKQGCEELIQKADIVFAPKQFIHDVYGVDDLLVGAQTIRKFGPAIVIVTDGENGLAVDSGKESFTRESFHVKTIDSNGAGDVFAGAFLHAYLGKKKLADCVVFAQAAAAIKCTRLGKEKLPAENEITEFIKSRIVRT